MGLMEKPEPEGKSWVIAGISSRAPLMPIYPTVEKRREFEEEDCGPRTPTGPEERIPAKLQCPPPPRKPKQSLECQGGGGGGGSGGVKEFFNPPDLETVFMRRVD